MTTLWSSWAVMLCLALVGSSDSVCCTVKEGLYGSRVHERCVLRLSPASCALLLYPAAQDLRLGSSYIGFGKFVGYEYLHATVRGDWPLWEVPNHSTKNLTSFSWCITKMTIPT